MSVPSGAARRVVVASAFVIALLMLAPGATIWRYGAAIGAADRALEARASSTRADQAITGYWREREAMNEYLLSPSPDLLAEIPAANADFQAAVGGLGADSSTEGPLAARAVAGNRSFLLAFEALRRSRSAPAVAIAQLNKAESQVVGPLDSLGRIYTSEVARRQQQKTSADREAQVAAVIGALVAILAVLGFALYTLRLVVRISARERELEDTVESLSDRDSLLARLR